MKELRYPAAARRSRAAHFIIWRNALDGPRRRGVEFKILLLRASPKSVCEVRFVPDLEIPSAHLGVTVAFTLVEDKGADEIRPLVHVAWRRHVALPPEDRLRTAGQSTRHEAEFHKGFHADAVEKIVKLVNVLPVVFRLAVIAVNTHIVGEDTDSAFLI